MINGWDILDNLIADFIWTIVVYTYARWFEWSTVTIVIKPKDPVLRDAVARGEASYAQVHQHKWFRLRRKKYQ